MMEVNGGKRMPIGGPRTPMASTPTEQPSSPSDDRWLNLDHYQEAADGFAAYDPEEWLPTLAFSISEFMFWPWAMISSLCLALTIYVEFIDPERKPWVDAPIDAHVILGGALSFLVVMRTDASMNRWQDARGAWQTICNCVTSLGAQTAPLLKDDAATENFLMELMAFAMSLKAYLRDEKLTRAECGPRMNWQFVRQINASSCPPMQALKTLSITVRESVPEDSKLSAAIFDEVSEQIRVINHAVGTCRLIKSTPMTKGYVTTLRSFLILFLVTLPLAIIGKFNWLATPVIAFISFLFLNVEKMAVEIEQPFGDDANDLPQEQYIMQLEEVLLEMLPGYEPALEESDEDFTRSGPGPLLPAPNNLPPGRYYMDVPPPKAESAGTSSMAHWNQISPAWRQQFRAHVMQHGFQPGPPPPMQSFDAFGKSRKQQTPTRGKR